MKKSAGPDAIPMQDVHHRIRNNLQVVSSLISIHGRNASQPEVAAILQELQDQLNALVIVNKHLYRPDNGGLARSAPLLTEVTERVLSRTRGATSLISLRFADLTLQNRQAVPMALLASEMLSYALDSVPDTAPEVALIFERDGDDHVVLRSTWDVSNGTRTVANHEKRETLITALATQIDAVPDIVLGGSDPHIALRFHLDPNQNVERNY